MNLTSKERSLLVEWIVENLYPRQSFNDVKTSYGLKHIFEHSVNGFYVDNDTFKYAMVDCGFNVKNKAELNWVFNISQKSPCSETTIANLFCSMYARGFSSVS